MKMTIRLAVVLVAAALCGGQLRAEPADVERDILVTFENEGARSASAGFRAPYNARRKYTISRSAKQNSRAVEAEYGLRQVDHWPIRALSVYCFVYRVPDGAQRDDVLQRLRSDERVESAQPLQVFESHAAVSAAYDDKFASLQHGLDALNIGDAHRFSRGAGVRVAVIDSHYDAGHEDLAGRVTRVSLLTRDDAPADNRHGTAVISVIGARSNNAVGIVGIAPAADLELLVSCWASDTTGKAICDSFTLAKAIDQLIEQPPHVLNLSLAGPHDPLIERLLARLCEEGVIVVAAASARDGYAFPADLDSVIGVGESDPQTEGGTKGDVAAGIVFAPGRQILVAIPDNEYDFRSGTSLATAHVTGVVALLLAVSPGSSHELVYAALRESQTSRESGRFSVNAYSALQHISRRSER